MVNVHPKRGAGNAGSKATGVRAKSLTRNKRSRNRNAYNTNGDYNLWCGVKFTQTWSR